MNSLIIQGDEYASVPMHNFGEPVIARAPASCGELVQGFAQGRDYLINSPISLFAEVEVQLNRIGSICVFSDENFSKMSSAVEETLVQLGNAHLGAEIHVNSCIPRAKGLASSTAEVASAIYATKKSLGYELSPQELSKIATRFDSTDGTYFPGISMLNQITGNLYEVLGEPPPLGFIICDTGGQIDTHDFNRTEARTHAQANYNGLNDAVALVTKGIQTQNAQLVADGATISAKINQGVLFKPQFNDLLKLTKSVGGLGVNCAHTGTVLGVMFDPREGKQEILVETIEKEFGRDFILGCYRLIPGGVQ